MKVGDVVKVLAMNRAVGIIVAIDEHCGWPHVMIGDGRVVSWPEDVLELIDEGR